MPTTTRAKSTKRTDKWESGVGDAIARLRGELQGAQDFARACVARGDRESAQWWRGQAAAYRRALRAAIETE